MVNWLWVGAIVMGVSCLVFVFCLTRGQWSRSGLAVGLANLVVVALHSVAPIRGWADPDYAGFSVTFFRVEPGPMVTAVAGSIFLAALASSCIAALNKTGRPMWIVALFDGVLAINFGIILVGGLVTAPNSMKINLGEYLTIPALPTVLLLLFVFTFPLAASALWAYRRTGESTPVI